MLCSVVSSTICPFELKRKVYVSMKIFDYSLTVFALNLSIKLKQLFSAPLPLLVTPDLQYILKLDCNLYLQSTCCTKFALCITAYTCIYFISWGAFLDAWSCSRVFDDVALTGLLRHFSRLGGTEEIFLPDLFFCGWILAREHERFRKENE